MSEIKVGDLVMVVRAAACCGYAKDIGHVFRVCGFKQLPAKTVVACCLKTILYAYNCALSEDMTNGAAIRRLKRIDPLSEPETITTDEEIHA